MKRIINYSLLLVLVVFLVNADVFATSVIYTDDFGDDWECKMWDINVETSNTHNASASALSNEGQFVFYTRDDAGVTIDANPKLNVYVNFFTDEDYTGHSITSLRAHTVSGDLYEFDNRGAGWTYSIDGQVYQDTAEAVFDTDEQTWQLFELDLSQVDYYWDNGNQPRYLGSSAIDSISFSGWDNTTGDIHIAVDDAMLVPEPTTAALLGLGSLLLIWRKK